VRLLQSSFRNSSSRRGGSEQETNQPPTERGEAGIYANIENSLRQRADELFSINDRFRNISLLTEAILSITCFYERVQTAGLGDVVVDQDSAVLGYTGEEDVGLRVDHRGLVRFSGTDDDNYDIVYKTMRYKLRSILEASQAEQGKIS